MVTDRVGDFIIRLQNAAKIGKAEVSLPYSSHIFEIAKKLRQLDFLTSVDVKEDGAKKTIVALLSYDARGVAKLRGVKRISKPGRRLYVPAAGAHRIMGGTGARVISSPKGIITDSEARKHKVGGEDLFQIW